MALRNWTKRVSWILMGSGMLACSQSVEETVIVPTSDAPVVLAFLCPQDSVHTVEVRYTTPAIGQSRAAAFQGDLKQSIVSLTGLAGSRRFTYDSLYRVFRLSATQFPLLGGQSYVLSIQMPGRATITASCTIPATTVLRNSVTWTKTADFGDGQPLFTFQWVDLPDETNYYAFFREIIRYDSRDNQSITEAEKAQTTLSDQGYENRMIVTQPVSLPSKIDFGNGSYTQTVVHICHTDKNYYAYHQALSQLKRDETPFSEPSRLPSNVINGYGIVAGYNRIRLVFN